VLSLRTEELTDRSCVWRRPDGKHPPAIRRRRWETAGRRQLTDEAWNEEWQRTAGGWHRRDVEGRKQCSDSAWHLGRGKHISRCRDWSWSAGNKWKAGVGLGFGSRRCAAPCSAAVLRSGVKDASPRRRSALAESGRPSRRRVSVRNESAPPTLRGAPWRSRLPRLSPGRARSSALSASCARKDASMNRIRQSLQRDPRAARFAGVSRRSVV
jgi:hypothetical protein